MVVLRGLLSQPIQQFRRDRRFYLRYDAVYLFVCLGLCGLFLVPGFHPIFAGVHWNAWSFVIGFPAVLYFLICCHLWIHNATHGSFPRWANRIVGEGLGFIVFVRFASWQIVHLRHHDHSDDRQLDPHPNYASYFTSFFRSIVTVERQLQNGYYEIWGETEANRRHEAFRVRVSYATNIALVLAWYLFLGPVACFAFWVPGNLLAAAFIGHFNWATHNGQAGKDYRPVNLDGGYYWLGNRLFTGIYFHKNHHLRPYLFNPRRWDESRHGRQEPPVDATAASLPAESEQPHGVRPRA
jgi:fatty acid desaturase